MATTGENKNASMETCRPAITYARMGTARLKNGVRLNANRPKIITKEEFDGRFL